jgi:fluoride ion exporter CrcB/FEX
MLSSIWVSLSGAISRDTSFWISGMVAQRCGKGFRDEARAINGAGSFFMGLSAALADSERRRANVEGKG